MSRARIEGRIHVSFAVLWFLLAIPTVLWWKESILWVLMISIYANIASHWSAFQGARAEQANEVTDSGDSRHEE